MRINQEALADLVKFRWEIASESDRPVRSWSDMMVFMEAVSATHIALAGEYLDSDEWEQDHEDIRFLWRIALERMMMA